MVNKVSPRGENLWIDGGAIGTEDNFWELIVSELGGYTEEEISTGEDMQYTIAGATEAEGNLLLAKVNAGLSGTVGTTGKAEYLQRRSMSNKVKAISLLQETKIPLIIDDFHYISKPVQKLIVRALKAPIMYGVPVICIAIPSRKFDVIDVERELTGRMDSVEMPVWDTEELALIAKDGFSTLNAEISEEIIYYLAGEAFGSPFLMQDFCRSICQNNKIEVKQSKKSTVAINCKVKTLLKFSLILPTTAAVQCLISSNVVPVHAPIENLEK